MRSWWGAAAFPTILVKLLICKSHSTSISVPPVASWWFEINNLIAQECCIDYQLHSSAVFVQVYFVWLVLDLPRMWKACDVLLYPLATALTLCCCLVHSIIPKTYPHHLLMRKCKIVIFSIFFSIFFMYFLKECREYFLCGLSTVIRLLLWTARHIMVLCMESDGKQALWLPFTFTVHRDGLSIPFCCLLPKRKHFEDKIFIQHFGLSDMNGAFRCISASWVKVFLSGLRKPKVFIVISVHWQLLPKM